MGAEAQPSWKHFVLSFVLFASKELKLHSERPASCIEQITNWVRRAGLVSDWLTVLRYVLSFLDASVATFVCVCAKEEKRLHHLGMVLLFFSFEDANDSNRDVMLSSVSFAEPGLCFGANLHA